MAQHDFKPSLERATVLQIVALTIFASMLLFLGADQRTTLESVNRANNVIGGARELVKLTIDMETGLRGFQITGRQVFLQPYNEASQVLDAKFAALAKIVADNPSQAAQLASTRENFNQWRLQATRTIRAQDDAVRDSEEVRYGKMLEGKAAMDELRAEYNALITSELGRRNSSVQNVRSRSVLLSVSSFLFAFVGAGVIWLLFRRQVRDLSKVLEASRDAERTRDALALAGAQQEKEDAVANYRGQEEAINRSQMMIEFNLDGTITLPGGQADATQPKPAKTAKLAGRHVLLVEDNDFNRDIAAEVLTELGIAFTVAVNGREAVDLVGTQPFDLVLMDIQMPVMDGLTATKLIRADSRFRSLPILAMTAHAMNGDRERSLGAGMNDHITKPISFDELTMSLIQWMPAEPAKRSPEAAGSASALRHPGRLTAQ